ncbi:hypothetical protein [Sorangium sp. So ce388]
MTTRAQRLAAAPHVRTPQVGRFAKLQDPKSPMSALVQTAPQTG